MHASYTKQTASFTKNPQLMLSRMNINRVIIISFMILVGFCLAYAINTKSFIGITLALVSLGAGIYFLYLLAKANEAVENEETI